MTFLNYSILSINNNGLPEFRNNQSSKSLTFSDAIFIMCCMEFRKKAPHLKNHGGQFYRMEKMKSLQKTTPQLICREKS